MSEFGRANAALLADLEGTLLQNVATRLPDRISSDMLTCFGLFGSVLVFFSYIASNWSPNFLWLASLGLIFNWVGDSLDGTLARVRQQERARYGFFVDHSADLITQILVGIGLGLSPFIDLPYALLALCAYLGFVAHTFIRARVFKTIQIAYYSVGPTEVRLLLIVANLLFLFFPALSNPIHGFPLSISDAICVVISVFSFVGLLLQMFNDLRSLSDEEKQAMLDKKPLPEGVSAPMASVVGEPSSQS